VVFGERTHRPSVPSRPNRISSPNFKPETCNFELAEAAAQVKAKSKQVKGRLSFTNHLKQMTYIQK
jgi:hypothetical protein